jgi:hypothetical protein
MKSYSLGRVFQYTLYHYNVMQNKYLIRLLVIFGLPLFIGLVDHDVENAIGVAAIIYFFASIGFASLSVYPMRDRGMKVLEMCVPVSKCERMSFLLLNMAVIYPLLVTIAAFIVALLTSFVDPDVNSVKEVFTMLRDEGFCDWWLYVTCQFFGAGALLINLLARRNLFVAYLIAFISFIALFSCVGWMLGAMSEMNIIYDNTIYIIEQVFADVVEPIIKVVYSCLPAIIYAICYVVLCKRQLKW